VRLQISRFRYSPKVSVFAPLVVLTTVFAVLMAVIVAKTGSKIASSTLVLAEAALIYSVAVILLIRLGLANVEKLELLGLTDSLSQLPNRRALHQDAQGDGRSDTEIALALIDLDGFKLVNDHYGHVVGDRVIKECATLLRDLCGGEARVYRLGGDEFAVLANGPLAGNILEGICRKLLTRLSMPIFIDERAIVVGASIGISRNTGPDRINSHELLRRTDVAMYVSKRAGKMRCTWFNEDFDRDIESTQKLDAELRQALANNEFHVHYQPLVDATTGLVVAVEALVRWERPDGLKIGPNIFIPIAEESGLVNGIGRWVLERALTDALAWGDIKLSVNVSAAQLRNPEFPIELGHLLEETGFPPHQLELEITETHLVVDSLIVGRSLELIRQFGVRIVLDDFGTGYASIGFLRQFRFEKLKIDRTLVVDAIDDCGSRAMMLASIAVARSLEMDVTAEGVETEGQADLARIAGCDQIQGWLYHKAMPASEISAQLKDQAESCAKSSVEKRLLRGMQ
jgi:diguanylate cyclase (GGDEF)-like protein